MDENMENSTKSIRNLTADVKSCENDLIAVINKYNFHPTISRLILVEILRVCEAAETTNQNQ